MYLFILIKTLGIGSFIKEKHRPILDFLKSKSKSIEREINKFLSLFH